MILVLPNQAGLSCPENILIHALMYVIAGTNQGSHVENETQTCPHAHMTYMAFLTLCHTEITIA